MRAPSRTSVLTLAAALAAGGAWTLGNASGAGAAPEASRSRLEFFIHDTAQAVSDVQPKGSSLGDGFYFHGLVYDEKGGKKIGRFGGLGCTHMPEGGGVPADSSCEVDYILPGGTIFTQLFGSEAELFGGKPFAFGVTGGTGRYARARGEGTMAIPTDVPDQTDGFVTLNLTMR